MENKKRTMKKIEKDQHIVPHSKGWAVKTNTASRVTKTYDKQLEAINNAKQRAKRYNSEMFIHGRDGKIRKRNSYGKD